MFAIIDVETTGLNFHRESLTEVAVILFDGQEVCQEYSSLIHPGRSIPYEISRLTGITNEMVADAPQFFEVARE
ncbi:MAG TPA: 3'-5' exonuclease, partial [Bacteroidales bacterium]|nr:3'-5' exonuclease [Bacteroidales bacterium]